MGAYFLKKQARSPILEGFGRNIYALLSFSGQQYLPMRFPILPKEPHWEYFKKAFLNISTKARKPQIVEMCINNESEYPFITARSIYPEKLQKSVVWDCDD